MSRMKLDSENHAGGSGKRSVVDEVPGSGREERIVFTFLVKNSEKARARTSGGA